MNSIAYKHFYRELDLINATPEDQEREHRLRRERVRRALEEARGES